VFPGAFSPGSGRSWIVQSQGRDGCCILGYFGAGVRGRQPPQFPRPGDARAQKDGPVPCPAYPPGRPAEKWSAGTPGASRKMLARGCAACGNELALGASRNGNDHKNTEPRMRSGTEEERGFGITPGKRMSCGTSMFVASWKNRESLPKQRPMTGRRQEKVRGAQRMRA